MDISGGFADGQTICDTQVFTDRPKNVAAALGADRERFCSMLMGLLTAPKASNYN